MLVLTRDLKYVDTNDLLKEQVEIQASKPIAFNEDDLKPIVENFQYEGDSISEDVKKLDFKIGAGVYFDVDKNPHEDCEPEEPKKKKFWFLPFSLDDSNSGEGEVTTMTVDSNLVVSTVDDHGGLFQYKPIDNDGLQGDIYETDDDEIEEEEHYSNKTNATVFSQFEDDCDSRGSRLGLFSCLLIGCLMAHYL